MWNSAKTTNTITSTNTGVSFDWDWNEVLKTPNIYAASDWSNQFRYIPTLDPQPVHALIRPHTIKVEERSKSDDSITLKFKDSKNEYEIVLEYEQVNTLLKLLGDGFAKISTEDLEKFLNNDSGKDG